MAKGGFGDGNCGRLVWKLTAVDWFFQGRWQLIRFPSTEFNFKFMSEEIFDTANERAKILFVCSRNRRRSLTAETIFKSDPSWDVRSAGTEDAARIKVTAGQLGWADVVVVMEKRHKERLRQKFPEEFAAKPCVCFFIADDYDFMEAGLIEMLRGKMREHFPPAGAA
jgi:predicted protein tyrosine phosphatase